MERKERKAEHPSNTAKGAQGRRFGVSRGRERDVLSGGRAKTTQEVRVFQSSSADLRPAEQLRLQRAVLTESQCPLTFV